MVNRSLFPVSEFDWLRTALDDAFLGATPAIASIVPVDIWTEEDGVVIEAELPGVDPDAVDISVVRDTINIKGERKPTSRKGRGRSERSYGRFERTMKFPYSLDTESVKAEFKDGVLTISASKVESEKPKRIEVKRAEKLLESK